MSIYIANAESEQFVPFNELQDLTIRDGPCLGHLLQLGQHGVALPKVAKRKLSNNKRVDQDSTIFEETNKRLVTHAEVIYPDRRIDQDHAGSGRRRGATFNSGSVPPNSASRRALSRAINALSASRTSADLFIRPVMA